LYLSAGPGWADEENDARLVLFSGQDLWRNGAFLYGGLIWAPRGLDRDGVLLKALLAGGQYRYFAGDLGGSTVTGTEGLVAVMPGWRIKRGAVEVKVFFGPELQQHRLSPDDPGNQLRGRSLGLRFATDIWAEPTAATMIAGDASLSSIGGSNSARAAFGWKAFDRFYVGPEMQFYGGEDYAQTRFGAHVTSLKIGATEWSAAGGWAHDTDSRSGLYVRINVMTRR
jgi:hypothetical protein